MDFYRPDSLQGILKTLAGIYRALRTWKIYPKGHPTRKKMIQQAYDDLLALLDGQDLSLECGRFGFALPDGKPFYDSSGLSTTLAYELFIRDVQRITILGDLHPDDLLVLLRIISLYPDQIRQAGGVEQLLEAHGVRTVWINQFDPATILRKRSELESRGIVPQGLDKLEGDSGIDGLEDIVPDGSGQELQPLLARLSTTRDEEIYLGLVRRAINIANILIAGRVPLPLLPLVELLSSHADNYGPGTTLAEHARFGLEQLAGSDELIRYLLDGVTGSDAIARDALLAIITAAGPAAFAITVEKMATSDNLVARKAMATLLVRIGEPAIPTILASLGDRPWYVVRNLVSILGDIGSPEAVASLRTHLHYNDVRVCKEAIRSLAKIGGRDAETAIITVLRDNDPLLLPQAITSLGGMRSRKALPVLRKLADGPGELGRACRDAIDSIERTGDEAYGGG